MCRGGGRRSGCPWLGRCTSCRSTTAPCSTCQCVGAPCGGFGRGLVKLKAVSGDSGDEWLVEPAYHHQGRLGTAGYARRAHRAAQECIKYLLAPPERHRTPQLGSLWLCPRRPSSPAVSRATAHFHRLRAEVWVPLARSVCSVPQHDSAL